jgi:transposase
MNNDAILTEEIAILREQLSVKDDIILTKDQRIQQLEALLKAARQQRFGASSEAYSPNQIGLFNEGDEPGDEAEMDVDPSSVTVAAHSRKKQKRASIPADIPREDIIYDLADAEKICPHDGTVLKAIGEESSEQLDVIPAQIKAIRHIRKKYACPCCEQYMVAAKKPKQAIEKSIASPGLLAYITVSKYCDALPLYRQVEIFRRIGIEMDRSSLANWMIRCGELVQCLINRIQEALHQLRVLHIDETPVQVLNEPGKAPESKSYMWVMSSAKHCEQPAVLFSYSPSRSNDKPKELLAEYNGAIMVDGYEGYRAVCTENGITRLGCWAHARRKFMEAQREQAKGKTGKSDQALALIQKLYSIERIAQEQTIENRMIIRQSQAQPVIDQLKKWLDKAKNNTPPQSTLGKAVSYLDNQWPRLVRYLDDGHYPIDNNRAENSIRPFVIGRKNWLFSSSQKGATASANLYSLIETAKLNGLEPYAYLKKVFTDLPNAETLDDIDALLPWNCKGGVG